MSAPGPNARRLKQVPRLPLSAFSPPNSGTGEKFPLPPSPSTVHPDVVVDANVSLNSIENLAAWKEATGDVLGPRIGGVVINAPDESILESLSSSAVPVISVIVPFPYTSGPPASPPDYLAKSSHRVAFSVPFHESSKGLVDGVQYALAAGHVVEIDVRGNLEASWDELEEFVGTVTQGKEHGENKGAIVLSNILPPPHGLALPTVRLLNHPSYIKYQGHISTLSLFPSVYIKFIPPDWDAPTPITPREPVTSTEGQDPKELEPKDKREWKKRVKMYFGPALEAYGFGRIIFGTSPSTMTPSASNPGDWYHLAREAVAELQVEQEGIDAIFGGTAKAVYGK